MLYYYYYYYYYYSISVLRAAVVFTSTKPERREDVKLSRQSGGTSFLRVRERLRH